MNDGWLTDHKDLEILIQEFTLHHSSTDLGRIFRPVILTSISLEIRNAAVLASSRALCKSGHTEYREMAFRLDGSIRSALF